MDKIAKSKSSTARPILHGTHITPTKIEVCDGHVAIIETFKLPVDTMTGDLVLSPEGLPVQGSYPDIERLIPASSHVTMTIDGKKLFDILRVKKGAEKAKLYTDDNETLRIRFDYEHDSFEIGTVSSEYNDLKETHFNPAYLLLMVDEVKETQGHAFNNGVFTVAWTHENEPAVMSCENNNVSVRMLITPIRR